MKIECQKQIYLDVNHNEILNTKYNKKGTFSKEAKTKSISSLSGVVMRNFDWTIIKALANFSYFTYQEGTNLK